MYKYKYTLSLLNKCCTGLTKLNSSLPSEAVCDDQQRTDVLKQRSLYCDELNKERGNYIRSTGIHLFQLGTCDSQKPQSCATDFCAFAICLYFYISKILFVLYLSWRCQTRFILVLMKKEKPFVA